MEHHQQLQLASAVPIATPPSPDPRSKEHLAKSQGLWYHLLTCPSLTEILALSLSLSLSLALASPVALLLTSFCLRLSFVCALGLHLLGVSLTLVAFHLLNLSANHALPHLILEGGNGLEIPKGAASREFSKQGHWPKHQGPTPLGRWSQRRFKTICSCQPKLLFPNPRIHVVTSRT